MTSLSCDAENSNSSLDEDSGCSERWKTKHTGKITNADQDKHSVGSE